MPNFLERWFDAQLELPEGFNFADFEQEQIERLQKQSLMALAAKAVPRRLGGDASPAELAQDKEICKKLYTRTASAARNWKASVPTDATLLDAQGDEGSGEEMEVVRQGVQVVWKDWLAEYVAHMQRFLSCVATHAVKEDEIKFGNQICNRLLNELNTIGAIFPPEWLPSSKKSA